MKLAVFLSRFPYPLEKGDKLRAYHQIIELSKNFDIYLFSLTDQKVSEDMQAEVRPYCKEIHIYSLSKALIYWNTAKQFFTDQPYQVGYFYQRHIHRKINREIKRIAPDHIYCQLVRTTEYAKNQHNIKKTVDYMDALGIGMQRQAMKRKGFWKRFFISESQRLTAYENRIFDFFDHHTIISEQDRQHINHPKQNEIVVVKNGISNRFFEYDKNTEPDYDLLFTGNMNYPPNIECAEFIANEILPKLFDQNINANLLLSGANPHHRVKQLAKKDGVLVSGWIDDIRDSYARGKIFVAPLFIGTGLQNKLLEAMAMGVPSVTTPLANNALGGTHDKNILVADSAEQFVSSIVKLLGDEELRKKIGQAGRTYVKDQYNWGNATKKLIKLIGE